MIGIFQFTHFQFYLFFKNWFSFELSDLLYVLFVSIRTKHLPTILQNTDTEQMPNRNIKFRAITGTYKSEIVFKLIKRQRRIP